MRAFFGGRRAARSAGDATGEALRCRLLGHAWQPVGVLVYDGCWVCDEECSRCGTQSWWPS